MPEKTDFTKEKLDTYFMALAKEYRRLGGKAMPAELILIGGASVLINYGFRAMTADVDALFRAASMIKDAINNVRDQFNLPNGWLNEEFKQTSSYSPKLVEFSKFYKSFYGVLDVRTVSAEYLIAMKLRSGRQYKNDLSDVLGILAEHEQRGAPITMDQIKKAVTDLYGSWAELPRSSVSFIENTMRDGNFGALYAQISAREKDVKAVLIDFEQKYPGAANEANVNEILEALKKRKSKFEDA